MLQYKVTHCGAQYKNPWCDAVVKDTYCDAAVKGYTLWCSVQEPLMWCCSKGHTMWCFSRMTHTVMRQCQVTRYSVQEHLMWCCSKGHTMWCCCTNISYFKHFNIDTVLHFCPPLFLTPDILTTVSAMQLRSYNARYTCSFQLSKWHYVQDHNNPYGDDVMSDTIDRMILTMSDTANSTYNLSEKHIKTQQGNTVFGFPPKLISVPNAQTWRLLPCVETFRQF
jgi:hypothetical protein